MFLERLGQHLAVFFVVLQRPDFGHTAEALECSQVRLVDMGEVRIRDDDVGEGLDITQAVGESMRLSMAAIGAHETSGRTSWAARGGSSLQSRAGGTL
jgi:hypothetical protein